MRPAAVGLDADKLAALPAFLADKPTDCVAVVKDGKLAGEWYFGAFTRKSRQAAASLTKSFASTLVGIAQRQGHLDIDEPASDFITEWKGTASESVTIRNLLSQDSGRLTEKNVGGVPVELFGAADVTRYAIGLSQRYPPGEHWEYSNAAVQTLEAVLRRATGTDVSRYAQENLFQPLGMKGSIAEDSAGHPMLFGGLQIGCLDAARFGWLFLEKGDWNGVQVVSPEWVAQATRPSQDLFHGYGLLWWLNSGGIDGPDHGAPRDRVQGAIPVDAPAWPDAPTDAYAAVGLGGQVILVLPSEHIVVVRLGNDFGIQVDINEIARLTLAALSG